MKQIIIVGGSLTGLALAREFGRKKCIITVIRTHGTNMAHLSKYTKQSYDFPYLEDMDGKKLVKFLVSNSKKYANAALIPDNDYSAEILSKNKQLLSKHYFVLVADYKALEICNDKTLFYEKAREMKIPAPISFYPKTKQELKKIADELSFPVILKPTLCFMFKKKFLTKAFKIHDYSELVEVFDKVHKEKYSVCISEIIPGNYKEMYLHSFYVDSEHNILGDFTCNKVREAPPVFGTASVMISVKSNPLLRKYTQEFVKKTKFTGFGMIEYKYNSQNMKYYVIDFNPRPIIMYGLFRKAGLDFTKLILADIIDNKKITQKTYREGVAWINLIPDLYYYLLFGKKNHVTLKEFFRPYLRKKTFAGFNVTDLRPFIHRVKGNIEEYRKK